LGRESTGKVQIKPTDQMRGLGTWHRAEGGAPCLYCKADIVAGIMSWGQVNPVQSNKCLPPGGASAQG